MSYLAKKTPSYCSTCQVLLSRSCIPILPSRNHLGAGGGNTRKGSSYSYAFSSDVFAILGKGLTAWEDNYNFSWLKKAHGWLRRDWEFELWTLHDAVPSLALRLGLLDFVHLDPSEPESKSCSRAAWLRLCIWFRAGQISRITKPGTYVFLVHSWMAAWRC